MAQTYQMKHNPQGTIYSLLTVESDGRMTMTFHGTDREMSQEANVTEDGRIATGGSLFPGLASGRWNKMEDVRGLMADVVETTEHPEQAVVEETTTFAIKREQGDTCINHAEREQSQDCESSVNFTNCTDNHAEPEVIEETTDNTDCTDNEPVTVNQPRPRRQRKPRKPRVEHQPLAIRHQTSSIDHQPSAISHQPSSTLKAIGMVAAATVALFVIYETGLLIPLGLIGLATGGILK